MKPSMRYLLAPLFLVGMSLSAQEPDFKSETVEPMRPCASNQAANAAACATPPHISHRVDPTYPEKSRRERTEGIVRLKVVVGDDGFAHDIQVSKSLAPDLDQAAIDAVKQWKFEPGQYLNKPVPVEITIEVSFRLSPGAGLPSTANAGSASSTDESRTLFVDANEAYSRRDYQTAANIARQITAKYPRHYSAWNLLGIALLELNELPAAEDALKRQIEIDPSSVNAYNNLGRVYWRERKYAEAEAEFRKQIAINPEDHYAHANLGLMLRSAKKCEAAMPELQRALTITRNNAGVMLAQGECDLDSGNQARGLSEIEQATSAAASAGTWNSAAYVLAKHKLELDRAEKWVQTALTIETAQLGDLSVNHISVAQLRIATSIASYWDTLGWVYFQRGDTARAQTYLEAAMFLNPSLECGDHLAQTYERLGRHNDAVRLYGMALASTEIGDAVPPDPILKAEVRDRLAKAGDPARVAALIDQGRADLTAARTLTITNKPPSAGSGDFHIVIADPDKIAGVHELSSETALNPLVPAWSSLTLPVPMPQGAGVKIPRRGTLSCAADQPSCRFLLLPASDAARIASREAASDTASTTKSAAVDPHVYDNLALGMRISLADNWKLVKEEKGSFSRPGNALFGKEGALAFLLLTREHLEAPADLYSKTLESGLARQKDFQRTADAPVVRDGVPGERWTVRWTQGDVTYSGFMEFFSVGDDHYRITAMAPVEVISRYSQSLEEMARSLQFPLLRLEPKVLDNLKP